MRLSFSADKNALWIGLQWDPRCRILCIRPLPAIGFKITFKGIYRRILMDPLHPGLAKQEAIACVNSITCDCSAPGWDGYKAMPISIESAESAEKFILALPQSIPVPEISPEPDGELSLDWVKTKRSVFSLSMGPNGRMAYAWMDDMGRNCGVGHFDGVTIPDWMLEKISYIVK